MEYIILGVVLFIIIVLVTRIKIVPQAQVYIVERLGTFYAEWSTGPHFLIPFLDRIAKKVSIKDQIVDFKPQSVITKDNVSMQIDTVVFFQVTDAKQYAYGVERPLSAIENLCATTLRNIIGDMVLDETLTSRDRINKQITAILDEATDRWGIKVSRVELKNILPPREIQDSMEKQMKAERESREKILLAEGEKKSKILVAQAEKEAMILRAEAVKEKKRLESEGDAVAISKVQTAKAEALERLNEAKPSENVLKYKALEYFPEIANGRATKIIIPSEIQGIAGLAAGVMETVTDKNITEK